MWILDSKLYILKKIKKNDFKSYRIILSITIFFLNDFKSHWIVTFK